MSPTDDLPLDDALDGVGRLPAGGGHRHDLVIGESDRTEERTLKARMLRALKGFAERSAVVLAMALVVAPMLMLSALTLDLPLTWFDGWAERPSLRPSNWISRGEAVLAASLFVLLLMTRRRGSRLVGHVQGLSWLLTLSACALMLVYLAPQLSQDDLPRGRYVVGLVFSWTAGQLVAITVYDAVRGGRWWRAPFYAALFGFGVQVAAFFPIAYGTTDVPWASWMFLDYCLKVFASGAFLGLYWLLRRRIAPRGGLGGVAVISARRDTLRRPTG